MTGKKMTKEEISKAVELMKPIYDIETPIQELMCGHYALCSYAYNISIELTKYKRAFEILEDKLKIGVCLQDDYPDGWTLYGGGTKILSQEEYELLEELMKDDN